MERSDSTNGAKRLHLWSEATLFGGGAVGGMPPRAIEFNNHYYTLQESILWEGPIFRDDTIMHLRIAFSTFAVGMSLKYLFLTCQIESLRSINGVASLR